ncbi:hypothetical protein LIER_43780 [Lithospermum erythrorhizon]|uniref:GAG-pre-integrase domain-containing protein n=1 Tax=Lithospermum erythrorhizon TaxID=34254 RepID=A0AAV3QTN6_LITER
MAAHSQVPTRTPALPAAGRGKGWTPPARANVVVGDFQADVPAGIGVAGSLTSPDDSLADLKPEQVRVLLNMIRNQHQDQMTVCAVTVSGLSQFKLWHRHLGHPSDRFLKLVSEVQQSSARKQLDSAFCLSSDQAVS